MTGANKGIGLEIARQLAAHHGMTVLIGARDEARGREAAGKLSAEGFDVRPIALDVTDQQTIDAAARRIETEFGRLDVLVNNAGVALDQPPPSQLEMDVLRRTYETNVFGVFATTKAMLPLLRRSPAGPHRQHVERARIARAEQRPALPVRGDQAAGLQLVQDGGQRDDREKIQRCMRYGIGSKVDSIGRARRRS